MPQVVVKAAQQVVLGDGRRRTVSKIVVNGSAKRFFFDTAPDVPFVQVARGDLFVAQALVVAMARGLDLVMEDAVSADRIHDLGVAQDILASWYPNAMRRVTVTADTDDPSAAAPPRRRGGRGRGQPRPTETPAATGTATFFTGGVDSFYSLLKNEARVDALIFGVGLDIPRTKTAQIARVTELLGRVGDALGKRVLIVDTNVRRLVAPAVNWGAVGHGPALAGMATVFSPLVGRVLVPATHSYAAHVPWGSHPLLDPRWSTRRLVVEHDGAEANRFEKIRAIADSPVVHENLRVCYRRFTHLNCGRCMKCLRTMMALHLLDRLEHCSTFARPLDLELFATVQMKKSNHGTQVQIEELAALADSVGGHDPARRAIATLSDRHLALLATQGSERLPHVEGTRPWRV